MAKPKDSRINKTISGVVPNLGGVSETMLWTLYDRACDAQRPDGVLTDPHSVRICAAIDYDFRRRFGPPVGYFAARALAFDDLVRSWLQRNPDGLVVSLGEGLETQSLRVDNGQMRWLTIDLPAAIELREQFITPTERCQHLAGSVLDPAWMTTIDASRKIFIVAQGLFMYLEPTLVQQLFVGVAQRFSRAEIAFDVIPQWFSKLTKWGLMQTSDYRLPAMPWGINRYEVEWRLRSWTSRITALQISDYRIPYGWPKLCNDLAHAFPLAHNALPCVVHVQIGSEC